MFPYKLCVTEKRTYLNRRCNLEIPYLLTVLLSISFNKLPYLQQSVVAQAQLAMRHLIRILQVYQLEATNIVQIVCYVSSADYSSVVMKTWNEQFYDEDRSYEHLLTIVVMPRLPRNAKVEWHAIAAVDRKLSR